MKIVLVALNARFSHSNPALMYLKASAPGADIVILPLTINDPIDRLMHKLIMADGDAYGFSCYIWNMAEIQKISECLKKAKPSAVLFAGGPEVSFDAEDEFKTNPFIDYYFIGECELNFPRFVDYLEKRTDRLPEGIATRENPIVRYQCVDPLSQIPFPYDRETLAGLSHQMIYYESMRGCPFSCSYCLSSTIHKVRTLPLDRVFRELRVLMDAKVKQVKFVDRTFNVDIKRCNRILKYLAEQDTETNFHFEIAGDLIDDEMIDIVAASPKGRFQFEIGIQSTHEPTLAAIDRKTDTETVLSRTKALIATGKAHIHVDLIAGLPFETLEIFKQSFNDVYALGADMFQLGFLKLLKGTKTRREAEKYGYVYRSFPQYEIIANRFISSKELMELKRIEVLVDGIAGCGRLTVSRAHLIRHYPSSYDFFKALSDFALRRNFYDVSHGENDWYRLVKEFICQGDKPAFEEPLTLEMLCYDYLLETNKRLPSFLEGICPEDPIKLRKVLHDEAFFLTHFPELSDLPHKKRLKQIRICLFSHLAEFFGLPDGSVCLFFKQRAVWYQTLREMSS